MADKVQRAWCEDCQAPRLIQKQTRKLRSAGITVMTGGALVGAGGGKWWCGTCGSNRVRRINPDGTPNLGWSGKLN